MSETPEASGTREASGTQPPSVRLAVDDVELTVRPAVGCRIGSLRIGGRELLRQGDRYGAFPMVPWCGRTALGRFRNGGVTHQLPINSAPHAIHGTGRQSVWRQAPGGTEHSAAFTYDLADPWPYTGRVTQVFELAADSLRISMCVETGDDSFPAQAGWHPWFLRSLGDGGKDAVVDFAPEWQEERGADHMPTGNRVAPRPGPWDDCFGMPEGVDATLTWPEQLSLRVTSPAQWVVVYDEQPEAVCVEPQSGPPNGLNTAPRLVTPIDPLETVTTWSWQRLG